MNIRKAKNSDKTEVLNFCKNTFEWGDYIDRVWDSWENDSSGLLLVAKVTDIDNPEPHPIAISHISVCPYNLLWVEGIRVNRKYRNQGISSSLLKYMLDFGIKNGLKEASAIVSLSNIASQKMLEKQGFYQLCKIKYYNIELKKEPKNIYTLMELKLKFKIPHPKDIVSIIDYLCNSKVSRYMNNRYFISWKFYKFENTFSSLISLITNNKILLVIDEINKIYGIVIINLLDNKDVFYKKPLVQIGYIDCINYYAYVEVINLLISTYSDKGSYCDIQFFLPDFINLKEYPRIESTDYFEQFFIYIKNLKT
ncbi:MAG: GNAT family N-acetyltransferase [Thermoproteota archaeon]|nr:GNAT family N-acetyltransferase [Thermoproteota archaeon]